MNYQSYSYKGFFWNLRNLVYTNKLGKVEEIEQPNTWEHMFKVSTRNRAVDILIFSSVNIRTGRTREKGADCVRLVMRWETRNGYIYKRLGKHYRLPTLFQNMEKTIREAQQNCFNLNGKEFQQELA